MQTKRLCRSRPLSAAPAGAIAKKGLASGTGRGVRHHKTSDTRRTGRRRLPDRALNPAAREINSTSGAGERRQQKSPVFAGNPYRHEARKRIVNQNGLRLSFLGRGFFSGKVTADSPTRLSSGVVHVGGSRLRSAPTRFCLSDSKDFFASAIAPSAKRSAARLPAGSVTANKPSATRHRDHKTRRRAVSRGETRAQLLMKIPLRFISSACGFGEKRRPSALLILPALIRR